MSLAVTKQDLGMLGLHLYSDALAFHISREIHEHGGTTELEPEVRPFGHYLQGRYSARFEALYVINNSQTRDSLWFVKIGTFLYDLFPSLTFRVIGTLSFLLLIVVIGQPVPFLVGPQAMSFEMRYFEWLIASLALIVTSFVFHRVCYEQWRFRRLIEELRGLIKEATGLSNRQVVLLIADASVAIANLSFTPCALVFLLFIAHLGPLGGAPLTLEVFIFLFGSIAGLALSFFRLRAAAMRAREEVRSTYDNDRITSLRLHSRLKSFATDDNPIQDNYESLKLELKTFVARNSTSQVDSDQNIYEQLNQRSVRKRLCQYLESCEKRNAEIVQQLGRIDSGLFAPLAINPILGAFLIPIGGAGAFRCSPF
jgi:hypothetical protein